MTTTFASNYYSFVITLIILLNEVPIITSLFVYGTFLLPSSHIQNVEKTQSTTLRLSSSSSSDGVWYSDPRLTRVDIPSLTSNIDSVIHNGDDINSLESGRFIFVQNGERGKVCHLVVSSTKSTTTNNNDNHVNNDDNSTLLQIPYYFTFQQIKDIIGDVESIKALLNGEEVRNENNQLCWSLIWLGNHDDDNIIEEDNSSNGTRKRPGYWALYHGTNNDIVQQTILDLVTTNIQVDDVSQTTSSYCTSITFLPLREFGDKIIHSKDAAIYSTANGLIEFHKSNLFCSTCGSPTIIQKAGISRSCSNHPTYYKQKQKQQQKDDHVNKSSQSISQLTCTASRPSIYPRIDIASIMLITSPCEQYALLGRKKSWPKGRYSTLAGFLEIGETLEQCCSRETLEESGVHVDNDSIVFVKSQPWPFPRSLMVGFRARAKKSNSIETTNSDKSSLPEINFDPKEMEDVQWFHRDYVSQHLSGGSTALEYNHVTEKEKEFHIPGKASLARYLITSWARE